MTTVNFENVEERTLVSAGWHPAKLTGAMESVSNHGNKMITVLWELQDTEGSGIERVFDHIMLEGAALWRTQKVLQALDFKFPEKGDFELTAADIEGLECDIKINHETSDKYGTQAKVADVRKTSNEE